MRIALAAIIAFTSSTHAAITVSSVSIKGNASANQGYQVVNPTLGQLYSLGTATGSQSLSITNPVSASHSISASPVFNGEVPPGAVVNFAPGASSSGSASLQVGDGGGIRWSAGGSASNGTSHSPYGISSAYVSFTFDVTFQVTQHSAIFSYHEQEYWNSGANPFSLYSGTTLILTNKNSGLPDPYNVDDFVLLPGTYQYKGSFGPDFYYEHDSSGFGSGNMSASITAIPEVSSVFLTMGMLGVVCVRFRRRIR